MIAAIVTSIGVAVVRATPAPSPTLPPVDPAALIASVLRAAEARTPVSGVVTTHLDLGIPQLPESLAGSAAGLTDLLSDQTVKVWRSPDGLRLAQILPFAERTLVASRSDVWLWDSQTATAAHLGIDAKGPGPSADPRIPDPPALAAKLIRTVEPYAHVATGEPVVVAGRDAYALELTPVSDTTLVGRIEVAVDASTRVPLRVEVFPKGGNGAAVEAGFSTVSFAPIDPAMFSFTPPPGARVTQVPYPAGAAAHDSAAAAAPAGGAAAAQEAPLPSFPDVRVSGKGFGVVFAVRSPAVPRSVSSLLPYSGPLGSAEVVERGDHVWIVAGLVPPDVLDSTAQKLP